LIVILALTSPMIKNRLNLNKEGDQRAESE